MKHNIPYLAVALVSFALPSQAWPSPNATNSAADLAPSSSPGTNYTDPAARKQAAARRFGMFPCLPSVGQIDEAGRAFDDGRHALMAAKDISSETPWAESLFLIPSGCSSMRQNGVPSLFVDL